MRLQVFARQCDLYKLMAWRKKTGNYAYFRKMKGLKRNLKVKIVVSNDGGAVIMNAAVRLSNLMIYYLTNDTIFIMLSGLLLMC